MGFPAFTSLLMSCRPNPPLKSAFTEVSRAVQINKDTHIQLLLLVSQSRGARGPAGPSEHCGDLVFQTLVGRHGADHVHSVESLKIYFEINKVLMFRKLFFDGK